MPFLQLLDVGPEFSVRKISDDVPGLVIDTAQGTELGDFTPLRPPASPRETPLTTPLSAKRNHVEFDFKLHETETMYLSSGEQSPVRGRTLRRVTPRDRNKSRSSRSLGVRSDTLDAGNLRERLLSRDLTATPEQYLDDTMLEPRPVEKYRTCSFAEEIERADTIGASSFNSFVGHRDTFALMGVYRLHNRAIYVPDVFFDLFLPYIDFATYKALRLSCRFWSQGITRARPIRIRATAKLPVEILERIYDDLSPSDFDAARHTCRIWMIASLESGLLKRKMNIGGWQQAAHNDQMRVSPLGRKMSVTSGNWLLSKRLATECSLLRSSYKHPKNEARAEVPDRGQSSPITLTSETDFSDLGHLEGQDSEADPPLHFDVSVCQKYLLVSKAHTIFIYTIIDQHDTPRHEYAGYLVPLNIVQCPGRVLAVSMNTTAERLSVAALFGDRLGMVFEMGGCSGGQLRTVSRTNTVPAPQGRSESSDGTESVSEMFVYNADGSYGNHTFTQCPESMAFDTGKRSVYKNICSAQDPPKSVAICPQRRCVAFGNATGIEVHWIDALSGQDLQRWFPLSSGCDCLYFLPNRIGIDSARKLRIIASAAHPIQAQLSARTYPDRTERLNKKGPWDDFTSEDQAWKLNWAFSRMSTARASQTGPEHYNATPLSDGNAILFTDPTTSTLFLGEGRLDQGLPELTRRFRFDCPHQGLIPFVYNAGAELRWGVRVLAAYLDPKDITLPKRLYLFTVPPDFFCRDDNNAAAESDDVGPINGTVYSITGIHIADISTLTALAIDASEGDLTLRAFSPADGGRAFTWQLAVERVPTQRVVLEDGITIPTITSRTDDVVMEDMHGFMSWKRGSGVFDGAVSPELDRDGDVIICDVPRSPPRQPTPPPPPRRPSTPMPPAPLFFGGRQDHYWEDEGYASDSDQAEEIAQAISVSGFAIHMPPVHRDWSGSDEWISRYLAEEGVEIEDEGLGADLVEATRVEVQIIGL